jgi:hypothetical protein
MRARRVTFLVLPSIATGALGLAYARAPHAVAAETHAPVTVSLVARAYGLRTDGDGPGSASSFLKLPRDQTDRAHLAGDPETCLTAAGPVPSSWESGASVVTWTLDARLLGATDSMAEIDLVWSRSTRGAIVGLPNQHTRVRLRHGDWLPFDIVRVGNPGLNGCDRLLVSITSALTHDLSVSNAVLHHDVWLLHREPDGREVIERVQHNSRQDAKVEYLFSPLYHTTGGGISADPKRDTMEWEISGTLRSRARPDGLVDLTVETWRRFLAPGAREAQGLWSGLMWIGEGDVLYEKDSRGIVGSGGVKRLTVRSGETIEVALPPADGHLNGQDLGRLLAGQSTALRITTTRVR